MRARLTVALVLLPCLVVALGGCRRSTTSETSSARAVVFVSADLRGYLTPCGCTENMRGGIARAAFQLAKARSGELPVLYIDGGNSLFGSADPPASRIPQDEARAKALGQALKAMKLDLRATGRLDSTRGEDFRRALELPELPSGESQILSAGDARIAVITGTTREALMRALSRLPTEPALFVLALVELPLEEARALLTAPPLASRVSLGVATRSDGEFGAEENRLLRGAVPVVQLQSKGRSLLRIDLALGSGEGAPKLVAGEADRERLLAATDERIRLLTEELNRPGIQSELARLKREKLTELVSRRQAAGSSPPAAPPADSFQLRFIPLDATLPSSETVAEIVVDYDRKVGAINLAWAAEHGEDCPPPAIANQAAFVGNAACRECHDEAFKVYEASRHAHAWETLEAVGKQFHLDCVGCHVTGADEPGGVCRIDRVAGREDVGCESCHGAGSRHAAAPSTENIVIAPGRERCVGCHNPENSPHFDFDLYLPRVLGPGHGG